MSRNCRWREFDWATWRFNTPFPSKSPVGVSFINNVDATGFREYYDALKGIGETVEIDSPHSLRNLASTVEKLSIGVFQPDSTKLLLAGLEALREIRVADHALEGVGSLQLNDLPALVSVRFGEECCEEGRGGMMMRMLPKLESVVVGTKSMRGFEECVLDELPSLRVIRIDACCFQRVHAFALRGWREGGFRQSITATGVAACGCFFVS